MDNLARQQEAIRPELEYGTVLAADPTLRVRTAFGEVEARPAASCLIRPEVDDQVLLSIDAAGAAWVLSVLIRHGATPTAMELEGDAVLRVRNGGLTVAPDTALSCVTGEATLNAKTAAVTADSVSLVSRLFSSQVERVKAVAGVVDDISREYTRRVVNYFRFTKEHEDCQAESRRQLVEETMTIQTKNAVITSEEHVKIDGELIHMG